jgi:hypothetical protein
MKTKQLCFHFYLAMLSWPWYYQNKVIMLLHYYDVIVFEEFVLNISSYFWVHLLHYLIPLIKCKENSKATLFHSIIDWHSCLFKKNWMIYSYLFGSRSGRIWTLLVKSGSGLMGNYPVLDPRHTSVSGHIFDSVLLIRSGPDLFGWIRIKTFGKGSGTDSWSGSGSEA